MSANIEIKRSRIESTTAGTVDTSDRIRLKIPSFRDEDVDWCGDECLVEIQEVGNEIFVSIFCCLLFWSSIDELLQTLLKCGELKKIRKKVD